MEFPFVSFVCVVISGHQCCHQLEDISMKRICMNKVQTHNLSGQGWVTVRQAIINVDNFAQNPERQKLLLLSSCLCKTSRSK